MFDIKLLYDDCVIWDYYNNDTIVSCFTKESWHKIARDVNNDGEWYDLIKNNTNFIRCYILKRRIDNHPIAFVYIMNEDFKWKTISIHGGAYQECTVMELYRGYILIIKRLLDYGVRVHTTCEVSNTRAIKFDSSIGFVKYKTQDDIVFMWINLKRLYDSRIYQFMNRHN